MKSVYIPCAIVWIISVSALGQSGASASLVLQQKIVAGPSFVLGFGQTSVASGSSPAGPITVDLNGDGRLDLVTTDIVSGGVAAVSVLLGNGDGTFQSHVEYDVPSASQVAAGDFNGDGIPDLALTGGAVYSILLGNGDGTFQPAQQFSLPASGVGLAVADFNGDGKLDLTISSSFFTSEMFILLGNGDGTFQDPETYALSALAGAGVIVTGDLNGDGKSDVAVALLDDNQVATLIGNGDGTFEAPNYWLVAQSPIGLAVADLNKDGRLDLIAQAAFLSVLIGNGDGTFQSHVDYASKNATGVVAADLTGDGDLDVASTTSDHFLQVFPGSGDGTLQKATDFYAAGGGLGLAVGDFNNDGMDDAAVTNLGANAVSLLLQSKLVLSRTAVNFGTVSLGGSSTVKSTLTNFGLAEASINKIIVTGRNKADYGESNNCGATLAPGASCTITVVFQPLATGNFNAFVQVSDSAVSGPQVIYLNGKSR